MVPILISKDVFEPSYNDLKFVAQNHSFICTDKGGNSIMKVVESKRTVIRNRKWMKGNECLFALELPGSGLRADH